MRGLWVALCGWFILAAYPASAANLTVNSNGVLTGATAVNVNGTLYDVQFVDGTCSALFSGCDATTDFQFQSSSTALAAGSALLTQVFVGSYDTQLSLIFGCGSTAVCNAFIPYAYNGAVPTVIVQNTVSESNDTAYLSQTSSNADFSTQNDVVWARFTLSAVPEPSTWALILLGFGGMGFIMRRKTSRSETAYA